MSDLPEVYYCMRFAPCNNSPICGKECVRTANSEYAYKDSDGEPIPYPFDDEEEKRRLDALGDKRSV